MIGDGGVVLEPGPTKDGYLNADAWIGSVGPASEEQMIAPNEPVPETPSGEPPNLDDKPPAGTNMELWAAQILREAWTQLLGREPTEREVRMAQAIARGESYYGWPNAEKHPEWQGHHNWGASHCLARIDGKIKQCLQNGACVKGFLSTDKINGKPYKVCFEHNETNVDGAKRFLEVLLVKRPKVAAVFASGDAYQVALAMRRSSYFARTRVADEQQMQSDARYYAGAIITNDKAIASRTKTKPMLVMNAPADVDPSYPEDPGWPNEVSNVADVDLPARSTSALGAVLGLAFGIGLGMAGRWAWKKWA